MSAMAEHDCLATHQPPQPPVLPVDYAWAARWRCPDCGHTWEWVAGADGDGGTWLELSWPRYTVTGPGSFML